MREPKWRHVNYATWQAEPVAVSWEDWESRGPQCDSDIQQEWVTQRAFKWNVWQILVNEFERKEKQLAEIWRFLLIPSCFFYSTFRVVNWQSYQQELRMSQRKWSMIERFLGKRSLRIDMQLWPVGICIFFPYLCIQVNWKMNILGREGRGIAIKKSIRRSDRLGRLGDRIYHLLSFPAWLANEVILLHR